jgi:uridine kinase
VIRASIDEFNRPRAERRRQGDADPRGYYGDSFDNATLRHVLLEPLGPTGNRRYRTAVFDFRTDAPVKQSERGASASAVLVFDGVFLLRPELVDCWDMRIFIAVDSRSACAEVSRATPTCSAPRPKPNPATETATSPDSGSISPPRGRMSTPT